MDERDYDFIVVGAGIAGPAVAVSLARQGWTVLVIERDLREPDRIVGELLQPGGIQALHELGMEECLEGIDSISTSGYEVFYHGEQVNIPYGTVSINGKDVPARGRGFHHGKFVMSLRKHASETKGVTMLEATVSDIVSNPHTGHVLGVKATTKSGRKCHFFAKITIVCDGISSKFRKYYNPRTPAVKSHFVGLVLENAKLPAPNHGHVIIGNHQPILIYQIGATDTRILCDVVGPLPSIANGDMKRHLEDKIMPNLPKQLIPAFKHALDNSRLRSMPAQFLAASQNKVSGLIMVGDAMNMRHPLTGGGMTVAFKDAVLLGRLLSPKVVPDLLDDHIVATQMRTFFIERKSSGSVINVLAMALYSLFAANDEDLKVLQRGCFRYFQLGGACVSEPVGLLGGYISRPWILFYHFFSVAFYGIFTNFVDNGLVGFPKSCIQVFTVLWTACVVFLPYLYQELKIW